MGAGSFTITTITKAKVEATYANLSCSASGWSLPSEEGKDKVPDTPNQSYAEDATSGTSEWDGAQYSDLRYIWKFNGVTMAAQASTSVTDHQVTGLTAGAQNTITVGLTGTCTKKTGKWKQSYTRQVTKTPKKDSEGKVIEGEYDITATDWRKVGSPSFTTTSTNTGYAIGDEQTKWVTVYTKPSGTFSWGVAANGRIDTTLSATDQRTWRTRCLAIFRWDDQGGTKSLQSWDVYGGTTITAGLYNAMVADANRTGLTTTIATVTAEKTVITANHWIRLANAVNF